MAVPRYRNTGAPFMDGAICGLSGFAIVVLRALSRCKVGEPCDLVALLLMGLVLVFAGGLAGVAWDRYEKWKEKGSGADRVP